MNNDLTFDSAIPRRGGDDIHGVYMGGAPLDRRYISSKAKSYRATSQLRTIKASSLNEAALNKQSRDTSFLKFDGKLEVDNADAVTELNKEEFLEAVKEVVKRYGLEPFFYMPNSQDEMTNIVEEPHAFDVNTVLEEHLSRMFEPDPIMSTDAADGVEFETDASKLARFRCYDSFESFDIHLSRLAIKSLISLSVQARVDVRFNHFDDYADLPGQVFLMMVLEVCNVSAASDIAGASELLLNMKLADYPGENIEAYSSDALRYIKIMQSAYALPYATGSKILLKVSATESGLFNRKVFARHDDVQAMEDKYELKDPKLLAADPDYPTLGPIPSCAFLQECYSDLIKKKNWPAKSSVRPEGNNAPASGGGIVPYHAPAPAPAPSSDTDIPPPTGADIGRTPNRNGRSCHKCNSYYHMANWVNCPRRTDRAGSGRGGFSAGRGAGRGNGPTGGLRAPNANEEWKYAHPPDTENGQLIMNGNTWFFCLKCKCKFTGKVGFFNKTHNTPDHTDPAGGSPASDSGSAPAPAASHTPSSNVNADISVPIVPSPSAAAGEDEVDPAPAGLVWDGAYHSSVHEEGVWMAAVDDPTEESIRSHSPTMFDDDHDEYHYQKALKLERETEAADLFEQRLLNFGMTKVERVEVDELNLNELIFEDSVEELEVAQTFANCNSCGDIGVLEKDCWCGGCFDISRNPDVFADQVLQHAARDADPPVRWADTVSPGGWNSAGSRPVVSTEPDTPGAPWGRNALGEPNPFPRPIHFATGEPLSPGDFGPKPGVDGEEPESRLCTGCGNIDLFLQTPPFQCLCGSLKSQPAADDWFGIALDPKPPMNNASAA